MSKLGKKLFIIILVISLGGLLLVSIFINFSIERQFKNYIYSEKKEKISEIASTIEKHYLKYSNWDNIDVIIDDSRNIKNIKFYITDNKGNIISYSHPGIVRGQNINREQIKSIKLKVNEEK